MPDSIMVGIKLAKKLSEYVRNGGAIIASYKSGTQPDILDFALGEFGLDMLGDAPFSPDFVVPTEIIATDRVNLSSDTR